MKTLNNEMYDIATTTTKKPTLPIPNYLHAKFLLWGYDPITDDEYLLGETTDKRIARSWVKETRRSAYVRIIIEYPGSYYTTARELRWCDHCAEAMPEKAPFCLPVTEDIPF